MRGWVDDYAGTSNFAIYYNQYATSTDTYGWSATSTDYVGTIPTFAKRTSGGLYVTGGLFGDVNGDGLPDYVTSIPGALATTTFSAMDRHGIRRRPSLRQQSRFRRPLHRDRIAACRYQRRRARRLGVFQRQQHVRSAQQRERLERAPDPRWTFATSTLYSSGGNYYDRGIRFMDLNGDGLPDLVRSYQNTGGCSGSEAADVKAVYLNTGSGWATSTAYALPAYITYCSSGSMKNNEYDNFNGNGQLQQDVLSRSPIRKGEELRSRIQWQGNAGSAIRVLAAKRQPRHDGRGTYATSSYAYSGGVWYHRSGVLDRRFAGFSRSPRRIMTRSLIRTTVKARSRRSAARSAGIYLIFRAISSSARSSGGIPPARPENGASLALAGKWRGTTGTTGVFATKRPTSAIRPRRETSSKTSTMGKSLGNSDGTFYRYRHGQTHDEHFICRQQLDQYERTEPETLLDYNSATSSIRSSITTPSRSDQVAWATTPGKRAGSAAPRTQARRRHTMHTGSLRPRPIATVTRPPMYTTCVTSFRRRPPMRYCENPVLLQLFEWQGKAVRRSEQPAH